MSVIPRFGRCRRSCWKDNVGGENLLNLFTPFTFPSVIKDNAVASDLKMAFLFSKFYSSFDLNYVVPNKFEKKVSSLSGLENDHLRFSEI